MSASAPRPVREDHPFDRELDPSALDPVLEQEPWRSLAASQRRVLLNCLTHDARLRGLQTGELVVREGDYGSSAFFVVSGSVRVVVERSEHGLSREAERRFVPRRRGVWSAVWARLGEHWREPEARRRSEWSAEDESVPIVLSDLGVVLDRNRTVLLPAGELFGEIAALGRTQRTASVFAAEPGTRLLEIRWQGLRDLRRAFPDFREFVDERFRARSLRQHLRATPIFSRVGNSAAIRQALERRQWTELFLEQLGFHAPATRGHGAGRVEGGPTVVVSTRAPAPDARPVAESRDVSGRPELIVHVCLERSSAAERRASFHALEQAIGCRALVIHTEPEGSGPVWQWRPAERGEAPTGSSDAQPTELSAVDPQGVMAEVIRPLVLDEICRAAEFRSFGRFEWARMGTRPDEEPFVAREGRYPNGVMLLRCGFARLSQSQAGGEQTVGYLGPGQAFGIEEIARSQGRGELVPLQRSLRALGYVDVVVIPTALIERHVLPSLTAEHLRRLSDSHGSEGAGGLAARLRPTTEEQGRLEFVVDHRFNNGTAAMVIDLDRCTRCDDCVRACGSAHEGNPRFIRHGPVHDGFMVANACMHCADPTCMIGCPTGAIGRELTGGQVVIRDATCIGCSTCANNCPYDNIRMVGTRSSDGQPHVDAEGKPHLKATKCDLCIDEPGGPACVSACAQGALERVDLNDDDILRGWFGHA